MWPKVVTMGQKDALKSNRDIWELWRSKGDGMAHRHEAKHENLLVTPGPDKTTKNAFRVKEEET